MDVHALRVFAEVVRSQGFTAAGRALHLTQPAISKAVKGLEQELGTPLLRREHRRIRLTDAGQVVLAGDSNAIAEDPALAGYLGV